MASSILRGAALYVRASTEHQKYSTTHQESALRKYAAQHDFEVVAIYRDEGKSGLTLEGRHGLLSLLNDVQSGRAGYSAILVYDVSRWGRFQDVDESAYYEYACRKAGIMVTYCAEPFTNDGSPLATLLKGLKRAMAAEYSRELSAKVFNAHCRFSAAGYRQGGTAGYGLRRQCISVNGRTPRLLEMGERKNLQSDRVALVHGPWEEVEVVKRIFDMCVTKHMTDMRIAEILNDEGVTNQIGKRWNTRTIKEILTNEKYAGTLVFNRYTQQLGSSRRPNESDKWIRVEGALPAIVCMDIFEEAMQVRLRRKKRWSDDEILSGMLKILNEHGKITLDLIEKSDLPLEMSYATHFRKLAETVEAAGVAGPALLRATIVQHKIRCITKSFGRDLEISALAANILIEKLTTFTYRINGRTVRLLCTRCRHDHRYPRWHITLRQNPTVDFVLWLRMNETNEEVEQMYLLSVQDFREFQCLWPSTKTLIRYQQFTCTSIPQLWTERLGVPGSATDAKGPSSDVASTFMHWYRLASFAGSPLPTFKLAR